MATGYEGSETGNWNSAENWSNSMIFRHFLEAVEYLKIAKFGCSQIAEEYFLPENEKAMARLRGLRWARECIELGMSLSEFAIRQEKDKEKVKTLLDEVIDLECPKEEFHDKSMMDLIQEKMVDRDSYKIQVNEEMFNIVYKILKRIMREITDPMNRSDLIFNFKEQFDPSVFKQKVKERFMEGD